MKEFRVAKCLVDGKVNEYAIFADGSRKKIIQTDKQYGKYFEVDNELNTDCKSFLRFSYSGRIKDAVEMIRYEVIKYGMVCRACQKTLVLYLWYRYDP